MRAPRLDPPSDGVTIWQVTDSHVSTALYPWAIDHLNAAGADVTQFMKRFNVACRLHTGDIVNHGALDPSEDTAAKAFLSTYMNTATDVVVPGNHDVNDIYSRTLAQWETKYGRKGNTATVIGQPGAQMLVLGICTLAHGDDPLDRDQWVIAASTLSWMDTQLQAHPGMPTWIACHYMLQEHGNFGTDTKAQPEADLVGFISDYPQIVGWLSGHAHWRITTDKNLDLLAVGNRTAFPSISGPSSAFSAIYGPEDRSTRPGPVWGLLITYVDADRIEIRARDHGAKCFTTWPDGPVLAVNPS